MEKKMVPPEINLEICADSVESCIVAQEAGAARIELCAALFVGGLTPSAGCVRLSRQKVTIPLHVLLRPRGGDFCYSDYENEIMLQDLHLFKQIGCDGVVLGVLHPDGQIDIDRTAALIQAARPMSVTFHRAFDMTPDPYKALEVLINLGVDRLLTSGQENSALEGAELIYRLIKKAGDNIKVMPGGGITERNIARLSRETGAQEFHLSARKKIKSAMEFRNERVSMGGTLRLPEYDLAQADAGYIKNVFSALNALL